MPSNDKIVQGNVNTITIVDFSWIKISTKYNNMLEKYYIIFLYNNTAFVRHKQIMRSFWTLLLKVINTFLKKTEILSPILSTSWCDMKLWEKYYFYSLTKNITQLSYFRRVLSLIKYDKCNWKKLKNKWISTILFLPT